jgi:hypothetical protein
MLVGPLLPNTYTLCAIWSASCNSLIVSAVYASDFYSQPFPIPVLSLEPLPSTGDQVERSHLLVILLDPHSTVTVCNHTIRPNTKLFNHLPYVPGSGRTQISFSS